MCYNACGRCTFEVCARRHVCVTCGSAHGSFDCTHALVKLINVEFGAFLPDNIYSLKGYKLPAREKPNIEEPIIDYYNYGSMLSEESIVEKRGKKRKVEKPCHFFNQGFCRNHKKGNCPLGGHFCAICESEDHGLSQFLIIRIFPMPKPDLL
jgi:hypothetical protein